MPRTLRFVIVLACVSLIALGLHGNAAAYTVKAGDTPTSIAKKHGVSVKDLLQANKGLDPKKIHVGDSLTIPGDASKKNETKHSGKNKAEKTSPAKERAAEAKARKQERQAASEKVSGHHTVKKGETLGSIAAKYGVGVDDLVKANKGVKSKRSSVHAGQRLTIPAANAPEPEKTSTKASAKKEKAAQDHTATYTVHKHDTPSSVARKFHISRKELSRLNPDMGKKLRSGQKLVVPGKSKTHEPEPEVAAKPEAVSQPEPEAPAKAVEAEKAPEKTVVKEPAPTSNAAASKEMAEAEAAFEKGIESGKQNNFPKAVENFDKAIKLNPNRADFYASRGHAHYYMKQYPKAINDYTKAIEKNPNFALAYSMRGLSRTRSGQYPKALEDFNKAITFGPNEADYYKGRGFTHLLMEQYGPMCQDYQKACSLGDCELLESAKKEKKCQ